MILELLLRWRTKDHKTTTGNIGESNSENEQKNIFKEKQIPNSNSDSDMCVHKRPRVRSSTRRAKEDSTSLKQKIHSMVNVCWHSRQQDYPCVREHSHLDERRHWKCAKFDVTNLTETPCPLLATSCRHRPAYDSGVKQFCSQGDSELPVLDCACIDVV